ncbi:MAG: hypothetical protein KBT02_12570 [Treponema sp.]|nr:hypothetical protein [Candidatus Treponema caballi]
MVNAFKNADLREAHAFERKVQHPDGTLHVQVCDEHVAVIEQDVPFQLFS